MSGREAISPILTQVTLDQALGNITGKPKRLVQKCFEKIGKISHFGKSGHSRSVYSDPISYISGHTYVTHTKQTHIFRYYIIELNFIQTLSIIINYCQVYSVKVSTVKIYATFTRGQLLPRDHCSGFTFQTIQLFIQTIIVKNNNYYSNSCNS